MPARSQLHALLRSLVAAALGVLVLSLGLLAHLPAAHARLHASGHTCTPCESQPAAPSDSDAKSELPIDTADHICAITLFTQGTDTPPPALLLAPPQPHPVARLHLTDHSPRLRPAARLLPPGRAPPSCRLSSPVRVR
ncbi:MAG: hypothetical protein NTU80_02345 [Verrucomicrobia bacterium]|nr:hypothetical protein [Verrucomicrobiota bacterium]